MNDTDAKHQLRYYIDRMLRQLKLMEDTRKAFLLNKLILELQEAIDA